MKFVPKGQVNNILAVVQIMAWHRPDDKPLSEPMMVSLLTHIICVTRRQWINNGDGWTFVLCSQKGVTQNWFASSDNSDINAATDLIILGDCKIIGRCSLQWRHNGRDCVSNHQLLECLLSRLFRHTSTKTSKLRVTGLCEGKSPETGEFLAQRASNAENVSIWCGRHVEVKLAWLWLDRTVFCSQLGSFTSD